MDAEAQQYPKGFTPTSESESELYRLALPSFEGPLDLLLFLIKKHDVDIIDIPVGLITEQYLGHLDIMQSLNIDLASGFLQLAAELTYIKSKLLVPQPEGEHEDDEDGDPRADLVRRLLEYQKYKDAGEQLAERDVLGRDSFIRSVAFDPELLPKETKLSEVSLFQLIEALDRALARTKVELRHEVVMDRLSVADKLQMLVDRLRMEESLSFSDLFVHLSTKREMIVTFLALLEVTKLKLVRLHQVTEGGEIHIRAVPQMLAQYEQMGLGSDQEHKTAPEAVDEYR